MPNQGSTTYSVTDLRKQLLANGYVPLASVDKRCTLPDWGRLDVTEELIKRWSRSKAFPATGVRLDKGLAALDFDIDNPLADDLREHLEGLFPVLLDMPLRHAGGNKFALFCRVRKPFRRYSSRVWAPTEAQAEETLHLFEAFGGEGARYFGAFGPHTMVNGEVRKSYEWDGDSLLDIPLSELPEVDAKMVAAVADAVDAYLEAAGWFHARFYRAGMHDKSVKYTLTSDMVFDTKEHGRVSLDALKRLKAGTVGDSYVVMSASWLDGIAHKNKGRCWAIETRTGLFGVFDSMDAVTHLEKADEPGSEENENVIAEKLSELAQAEERRVRPDDDRETVIAKLLDTYAYCPNQANVVVPIRAKSVTDGMTLAAFKGLMQPHAYLGGPKGNTLVNPSSDWLGSDKRVSVAGLRLRPDMPRPTYEEGGQTWINTYAPPAHDGSGSTEPWHDFMEGLLPNPVEREWFLDWLAYKFAHPWVPGPGVVMVARRFGTGRGTLGSILKKLFGASYVRSVPFSIFAGKSYQSQYNDWMADSLVVLVNESSESDGGSQYAAKRDTYEHIKEVIEPRAEEKLIVLKGKQSYMGMTFASFLIATNHIDALPVPEDDRRLAILTNGEPREQAFWEVLNAWADGPGNIAALARWLTDRGWGEYSPYLPPPEFEAKALMADANKSELDIAIEEAVEAMEGECFTLEQVLERVGDDPTARAQFPGHWERLAKRTLQSRLYRVGVRDGQNWKPRIEGARYSIYAARMEQAKAWTKADAEVLKTEVLKNGKPGSVVPSAASKLRLLKGGKDSEK